tara:strand:+ start:817 stop:2751 length:1935 start_codon:yes stop_codon:yes gene_type:complete
MAVTKEELLEQVSLARELGDEDAELEALELLDALPMPQPQQAQPLSAMESVGGAIGQINQSLTFGMADEMAGGMSAINPMAMGEGYFSEMSDRYTQGREGARGLQGQFTEENPNIALLLEAAGAMALGMAAAPKVMGMMGMEALPAMSGQGLLKSSQLGALEGAAYGYGTAEGDAWDTATNMAGYGGAGALLNPAMDATLAGGTGLWNAAKNKWNRTTENKSAAMLGNLLESESITPQGALDEMQTLGPEAILADVGPNLRAAADVLSLDVGAVKKRADAILESRQMGQQDRVMGETAGILGADPSEFMGTVRSMNQARFERAQPLYDEAMNTPVEVTPELAKLFERPSVRSAMKNVKKIAEEEGVDVGDIDWNAPTMQQIDTIKKALDKQVGIKKRGGNDDWRRINTTKNQLLDAIDLQNPSYKEARNTWESDTKTMEAADYGRDIFKNNAEEAAENVAMMTQTERDSYVMGAVKAIEDKVQSTPDTNNAMRKLVSSPALRKKLRTAFPDDGSFEQFMKVMEREGTFSGTRQGIGKGSQTEPRRVARESLGISAEGDSILDMASQGLAQGTVGKVGLLGKLMPNRGALDPEVGEQVGNLLTQKGLTEEQLMKMISDKQKKSMSARLTPSFGAMAAPGVLSGWD